MPRSRSRRAVAAAVTLAVVGILAAGIAVARDQGPATVTPIEAPAGAQHAAQLAGTDPVTGKAVSLADYAGKPVVVNIWASWCSGCNEEADELARVAAAHSEVAFLGINFQDSREGARDFYREYGWRFPSIYDPRGEIAYGLGLQGTPTTIFLDAQHREVGRIVGATDEAGFEDALRHVAGT
jgi:thiol-disulfide isomerase/thioredoxin